MDESSDDDDSYSSVGGVAGSLEPPSPPSTSSSRGSTPQPPPRSIPDPFVDADTLRWQYGCPPDVFCAKKAQAAGMPAAEAQIVEGVAMAMAYGPFVSPDFSAYDCKCKRLED